MRTQSGKHTKTQSHKYCRRPLRIGKVTLTFLLSALEQDSSTDAVYHIQKFIHKLLGSHEKCQSQTAVQRPRTHSEDMGKFSRTHSGNIGKLIRIHSKNIENIKNWSKSHWKIIGSYRKTTANHWKSSLSQSKIIQRKEKDVLLEIYFWKQISFRSFLLVGFAGLFNGRKDIQPCVSL